MSADSARELKALLQSGWTVEGFQPATEIEDRDGSGEIQNLNGYAILLRREADIAIATAARKNGLFQILSVNLLTPSSF